MITQTNYQDDPVKNNNEMSPQTNIHTPNFEDDDFDIPQVALPVSAMAGGEEEKGHHLGQDSQQQMQQQMNQYGHQGYSEAAAPPVSSVAYYGQQQQDGQWLGEYQNHQLSYNYSPAYGQQQHYHHHHQQQYNHHGGHQYGAMYQSREEIYHGSMTGLPPGRSPSGSHSTPSPHSQPEMGEDQQQQHLGQQHHLGDLKRPHGDAFRHDNMNLSNPAKKPKVSRRKKKRDPNEPQKPVSAYALFFRDSQASIKGRNPNMSFGDVSKCVASMWDSLDPESKAIYKKRTEMAKKEYLRQLASYRATLVSNGQGDDIYGSFPGYGYPSMGGLGQSIPPHPPGPPQPHQGVYMANSQEYQLNHQATAHGTRTDISAGSQTGILPSLPVPHAATPDTGNSANSPSPPLQPSSCHPQQQQQPYPSPDGSYCSSETNFHRSGFDSSYHDRNHNSPGYAPRVPGQCGRPGCHNPVTKAADGTESTYCSSECVVGQCREVYSSWSSHHNTAHSLPTQQPLPAQVK